MKIFNIHVKSVKVLKFNAKVIDVDILFDSDIEKVNKHGVLFLTSCELQSSRLNNRVYGYSHLKKPLCILSTDGFQVDNLKRLTYQSFINFIKLCIHEVGHTYDIEHHIRIGNSECVMDTIKGSEGNIDLIKITFCEECIKHIRGKNE